MRAVAAASRQNSDSVKQKQTGSAARGGGGRCHSQTLPLRAAAAESLSQAHHGARNKKPAHRLQIKKKNCSAQITLMKNSSSLAGEISILMAHQAQLSRIMKTHHRCQLTAGRGGRCVAWPRQKHFRVELLGVFCFFFFFPAAIGKASEGIRMQVTWE